MTSITRRAARGTTQHREQQEQEQLPAHIRAEASRIWSRLLSQREQRLGYQDACYRAGALWEALDPELLAPALGTDGERECAQLLRRAVFEQMPSKNPAEWAPTRLAVFEAHVEAVVAARRAALLHAPQGALALEGSA
jgi:hypothetical protein